MSKFEKGDPRINRNGRPKKGTTITDLINKKLDKDEFTDIVIQMAQKEPSIMKYLIDRIDGKVPDNVAVDADINIVFTNLTDED